MPRGFVFELEPLLRQRRRVEQEHQREVATLERARLAIEDRIRAAQTSIGEARAVLRDELGGAAPGRRVALDAVRLQMNASLYMTGRAQQAVLELAGAHKRLEAARVELMKATTARRALELLRERRFDEWKREQQRREDRELDEINTQRASRADQFDMEATT
jgi:flagellar export protein FliJ